LVDDWLLLGEGDGGAVDDEAAGTVGRTQRTGEQVGTLGGEVEDLVLVVLALVELLADRLLAPFAVERVAVVVGQRVEQLLVGQVRVLDRLPVRDEVAEPLRLGIVPTGLAVGEQEDPLARGAEEVVAAQGGAFCRAGMKVARSSVAGSDAAVLR